MLLPASRPQELTYLMPHLARAAALLQRHHPDLQVLVPAGLQRFEQSLQQALDLAGVQRCRVIPAAEGDGLKTMLCAAADLAHENPEPSIWNWRFRVFRRLWGTESTVSRLLATCAPFSGRAHLTGEPSAEGTTGAGALQDELTAEGLVELALLLEDSSARERMLDGYRQLRATLGEPGVTDRAAAAILDPLVA